jgi:uncharacterized membrane protein
MIMRCCLLAFLMSLLATMWLAASEPALDPAAAVTTGPNPSAVRFFRERIEPVLIQHCYECHGGGKRFGGLKLDSLENLLAGGHEGLTIVPGEPDKGLLMPALRWEGDSDLNMPPKQQLPPEVIADFEHWIRIGAPWPSATPTVIITTPPAKPPVVGRLHPLLVHLPIGVLVLAGLAEALVVARGLAWSRATALALVIAAGGSAVAVASGLALAGDQPPQLLERHELLGWLTLVGALACAVLACWRERHPGSRLPLRLVLAATLIAMALAGHLGGAMVHGEDWLF